MMVFLSMLISMLLLVKLLLSISDGNSVPERGFSINTYLLQVHGSSISEKND